MRLLRFFGKAHGMIRYHKRKHMRKADIDKIRKYGRRTILETVRDTDGGNDIRYQIVQYTFPVFHSSDVLAIEFDNNGSYIYSAVYKSQRRHFQPVYQVSQRLIDAYFKGHGPEGALVLGCAGCTIPRFLLLHFNKCRVVGVEYSQQFVDIAERFFISEAMRPRFDLVCGDGFEYVANSVGKQKFDLVYTDIYVADIIHPDVYTNDYISQVCELLRDDGIAVINSFRVPFERIKSFVNSIQAPFGALYIIEQYRKHFIVLCRTADQRRLADFEKRLPGYAQIDLKIIKNTERS